MQCPVCATGMVDGRFGNHGEKWHQQAFGPFGLPLAFQVGGADEVAATLWLGGRAGAPGLACPRCGTVVITEPPPTDGPATWECPACGEIVPMKFDTCWKCQCRRPSEFSPGSS